MYDSISHFGRNGNVIVSGPLVKRYCELVMRHREYYESTQQHSTELLGIGIYNYGSLVRVCSK